MLKFPTSQTPPNNSGSTPLKCRLVRAGQPARLTEKSTLRRWQRTFRTNCPRCLTSTTLGSSMMRPLRPKLCFCKNLNALTSSSTSCKLHSLIFREPCWERLACLNLWMNLPIASLMVSCRLAGSDKLPSHSKTWSTGSSTSKDATTSTRIGSRSKSPRSSGCLVCTFPNPTSLHWFRRHVAREDGLLISPHCTQLSRLREIRLISRSDWMLEHMCRVCSWRVPSGTLTRTVWTIRMRRS